MFFSRFIFFFLLALLTSKIRTNLKINIKNKISLIIFKKNIYIFSVLFSCIHSCNLQSYSYYIIIILPKHPHWLTITAQNCFSYTIYYIIPSIIHWLACNLLYSRAIFIYSPYFRYIFIDGFVIIFTIKKGSNGEKV